MRSPGSLRKITRAAVAIATLYIPPTLDAQTLSWTGADLRRVHTLYLSPNWASDRGIHFDPRQYVRDLKAAGCGTIEFYLKDHHGDAYFSTTVGNYYGRDLLAPLVEESHAQGMKLVAYYSVGLDSWAYEHHPEWRRADAPRSPDKPEFGKVDVQSGYQQYMLRQLEDIAAQPVDGWFLDVAAFPSEFGNSTPQTIRTIHDTIKKHRPASLITWNGAGSQENEALTQYSDFSSMEGWLPNDQSYVARNLRRLDKPFTEESPGSYRGWGGWALKPASLLQLEGAVVSANGGALTVGLNPLPDGTVKTAEVENLRALWTFIAEREPYFLNTRSAAEVAILAPSGQSSFSTDGLHAALMDYQIDYAVVTPDSNWQSYSLLIVPGEGPSIPAVLERLRQFVRGGGTLLVLGMGYVGLEDVLGINVQGGASSRYSVAYAALKTPALARNIPDYPVLIRGKAVPAKASTGTSLAKVVNPIAEYTANSFVAGWDEVGPGEVGLGSNPPGKETPYDMVVSNRFGHGRTLYVAGMLNQDLNASASPILAKVDNGALWQKQLLANMVDLLLPERLVKVTAPPGIEVVANWQGSRLIINLINHAAAAPGHFGVGDERILKATGVELRIDAARFGKISHVYQRPENRELQWVQQGKTAQIEVPAFAIHTFVIFEAERT